MAAMLYRDTGYSLTHLVEDIRHGNLALPDIQRPFVWKAAKVRDLFDSMYRGFPVGTLMLWETGAPVGTRQVGGGEADRVPRLLIVDGQQRLTSLFAVLTGDPVLTTTFQSKRIQIAFRPTDQSFEVADATSARDPELIPDITVLFQGRVRRTVNEYIQRLETARAEPLGDEEEDLLAQRIESVSDLADFRFQVVELTDQANEEHVAEIFVRINSEGVQLNQADFILTIMSVHWEKGRTQLEEFARAAVDSKAAIPSPRNAYIDPKPDQLLRVGVGLAFRRGRLSTIYNLLRGKDLETGRVSSERRTEQFERLRDAQDQVLDLTNWHEFLKCLAHAGFRNKSMITSNNTLLYTYVLWLIGRRDFGLDLRTLRSVIARWFFMAHTTNRYTSSPESQIESDLGRIRDISPGDGLAFCAELDRLVRAHLTGDYWAIQLPGSLDSSASYSPALHAYWAALNLLDAELLFSNQKIRDLSSPGVAAPRNIERHHLFPKKFLAGHGFTEIRQMNAIANMAYLDWPDNAEIAATDPREYLPVMKARLDPARWKRHEFWHALPVGWEQMPYPEFLEKRRALIANVIHEGFKTLLETPQPTRAVTLSDLLDAGESQSLEYKSTARWNIRAGQADKKMEQVIVKTVCGLLNGDGGTLLIGVDDQGNVLGLDYDYRTLGSKGNRDGYELFLRQVLDASLSINTAGIVNIRFDEEGGHDVCVVSVAASGRPVFARTVAGSNLSDFWVRIGNATKQLHGDEMIEYQELHWG
ncbi:MAG TPA: DUF262 domain-containing protein [Microlunatus sp.]